MHSSGGTPIFVPTLWPHSYYNTRYGLGGAAAARLAAAALVTAAPVRCRVAVAALIVRAGDFPWASVPRPKTGSPGPNPTPIPRPPRVDPRGGGFPRPHYRPGTGIITIFGDDLAAIYREMAIPLRETFSCTTACPGKPPSGAPIFSCTSNGL